MRHQFEGFAEGDRVYVVRHEDHYLGGQAYTGVLDYCTDGLDEGKIDCVQFDLVMDDGETELLESGPDAWSVFTFASIEKVEA